METKVTVDNVFSVLATSVDQFHARLQRMLRLQNIARSLMVCLIIAIPLKSFSQTCGPVLWGAGNGYPPGPYSSPDAACRILNGVTGPAEGWGPNAVYTDSNAAADEAGWEGTPTGGYPGSSTYCSYTLTITGCGESCPNVQEVTGALPYVYAKPPTALCPLDSIVGCELIPSCAQRLSKRQADYDAYKARCNEPPPPGLSPCNLAKWKLSRNTDCRNMRQRWDDKWSPGGHANDIANLDRRIQTLKDRAAKYCNGQKP
jgi:hypothetical protein